MRLRILCAALAATALSAVSAAPALATAGAGNVTFTIGGTLSQFPCPSGGCTATVSGQGDGAGQIVGTDPTNGDPLDATFTLFNQGISGSATYGEPAFPFCPLVGSATNTGNITLTGGSTGVVVDPKNPGRGLGLVTSATESLGFLYARAGVTPALAITSGSVVVNYWFPTTGNGSFTDNIIAGGGSGVFQFPNTTATQIESYCLPGGTPGTNVPYSLTGTAAVATT